MAAVSLYLSVCLFVYRFLILLFKHVRESNSCWESNSDMFSITPITKTKKQLQDAKQLQKDTKNCKEMQNDRKEMQNYYKNKKTTTTNCKTTTKGHKKL